MLYISSQTSMRGFQASRETCSPSERATWSSRNKKFLLFLLFWRLFWSFLDPIRIGFRIRIHWPSYILIPDQCVSARPQMYCTLSRTVYLIAKSAAPFGTPRVLCGEGNFYLYCWERELYVYSTSTPLPSSYLPYVQTLPPPLQSLFRQTYLPMDEGTLKTPSPKCRLY